MSRAAGFSGSEIQHLARSVERHGWRVVEGARPMHYLAYPPHGGRPVGFSRSGCLAARANVYAAFRRAGLELDPTRLPGTRP